MRKLYFLLPDIEHVRLVINELETSGLPHRHIHVVASIKQDLEDLPEATVWQKTELAKGLEWGAALGGTAGLLGGVLAVAFPPAGLIIGGGALLAGSAAGAGLGAAVAAIMKSHEHNHELDDYLDEISEGQFLLILDVPRQQVEEISTSVLKHHPEAHIKVAVPIE